MIATHSTAAAESRLILRNFGWMGGLQLAARVLRILTIILAARLLAPEDYGLAALVLAANEIFHVFSHGSVSSKLIQVPKAELSACKVNVYWLSWLLCIALTLLQMVSAYPLSQFYQQPGIVAPLLVLALSYLVLPLATVHSAMLIRNGRLNVVAKSEWLQSVVEAILTLILVLADFGFWALVLPKAMVAPLWVFYIRSNYVWVLPREVCVSAWRSILGFGLPVALNDLLQVVRVHFSALLIGKVLGVEALGIYYFATNAGLGLSMGLIRSLNQVLFSYYCRHRHHSPCMDENVFLRGAAVGLGVMIPLILLQSILAPVYVPLLFGERWVNEGVVPLLILLCISALPLPLVSGAGQALRAANRPLAELCGQVIYVVLSITVCCLVIEWGLYGVAFAGLCVNIVYCPLFAWWVWSALRSHRQAIRFSM